LYLMICSYDLLVMFDLTSILSYWLWLCKTIPFFSCYGNIDNITFSASLLFCFPIISCVIIVPFMSSLTIESSAVSIVKRSFYILGTCNLFQMKRIDTISYFAQMVYDHTIYQSIYELFIHYTMHISGFSSHRES